VSASRTQRFIALTGALVFLLTTVGFSVLVVLQLRNEGKQQTQEESLRQTQAKEGKLEGTPLADFTPTESVAELQKIDLNPGNGAEAQPGDNVTVHYTGAVAKTGTIFQSSLDRGEPIAFNLSEVIKGWTDGVPGMKVGGKRRLLIPAAQAYGPNPPPGSGIPANADLVFDIELVKIDQ
jgi:FKBP-type peptidyl-prolyl cis-trans isomerase